LANSARTTSAAAAPRGKAARANACTPSPSSRSGCCPARRIQLLIASLQLNNEPRERVAEAMLKVIATALLTAAATSMFWMWFYGTVPSPPPQVARSGNIVAVKPQNGAPVVVAEQVQLAPSGLAIPVVGISAGQLTDTFDDARSQGRRHDAIDIMAPEGAPVIAAADGTIEKLFNSVRGGTTVYERSADHNWIYYYAHLSAYAPGLAEGQQVKRGQVIARVG